MPQEIFLDFDSDDNPIVSVKGVKGRSCKLLTSDLEKSLGKVTSEKSTPEYFEREDARVKERVPNKR